MGSKNDILIVADDIYGRLVYNGNEFTPIATISEAIKIRLSSSTACLKHMR